MGFIASELSNDDDEAQKLIKSTICKYFLMQLKKVKDGKVQKISEYCPLDLFSGCRSRMMNALQQLLQNPQNNLRIFQDGCLIYDASTKMDATDLLLQQLFPRLPSLVRYGKLCELLIDVLLRDHPVDDKEIPLDGKSQPHSSNQGYSCGCKGVTLNSQQHLQNRILQDDKHVCDQSCCLAKGTILNRVLKMQMLSDLDPKALLPHYQIFLDHLQHFSAETVHEWLYGPKTSIHTGNQTMDNTVYKIRNHLLASSAMDCSIMITLGQVKVNEEMSEEVLKASEWILQGDSMTNQLFMHSVAVVDTDWKPHGRIPSWAQDGDKLVKLFLDLQAGHQ